MRLFSAAALAALCLTPPALQAATLTETKLLASDGAASDQFGYSVAISGTTALVGAVLDDDKGVSSGSAFLLVATTGTQVAKLLASA